MPTTRTPRTIYDITQLAHWGGNITGIPRVMNELAVRFRAAEPDAIFVVWVKEIREFCEVNLEETLKHRGYGIVYLRAGEPTPSRPATQTLTKTEPVPHARKVTPRRLAKAAIARSGRISRRLSDSLEFRARAWEMKHYKRVNFRQGDRLFIPWGEWWDPNFIAELERCHKQGVRLVQVLHDMSPIVVPQFSNSGNAVETFPIYCRRILPICSLVLSVSKNSEQDALVWLKVHKLKVPPMRVFRLGDDIKIFEPEYPDDAVFACSGLKGQDFILCVGTIELKKNHQLFYYVYKLAKARGIELPKLVLAGRRGWMTEATYELMTKDPEVKDRFVFQLNKSDEQLAWFYNNCLFSVLPSFYEGWGIPIAESLARGVPCLCSNTSSMTEIAEDFVEHFSPASTDECLAGIQRWLDPAKLEKLREHTKQYKQYSWNDSFTQIKQYIKETL